MIIWPTVKKPVKSYVLANTKRGRQIAAQNPAKDTISKVIAKPLPTSARMKKLKEFMEVHEK